jgi:Flp pilus assembly protein TadG
LALLLPIIVTCTFVIIEASQGFAIARDLQIGAELAARALATEGSSQGQVLATQQTIFSNIVIPNRIVDSSQFSPAPYFNHSASPPTVTVYVQYKSTGTKKPPTFPNPDPLNLGSTFVIKAQATYRLQS